MSRSSYQITPEIYHLNNSVYIIKVNGEDFCYTETRDIAYILRDKLAITLVDELKSDPKNQDGWTKICTETNSDNIITISTVALGRLYDGVKKPVYTSTVNMVFYGMVRLPPAKDQRIEEPQYATLSSVHVETPKTITVEVQPQPQVAILSSRPLPPLPSKAQKIPVPPPLPSGPKHRILPRNQPVSRFDLDRVIDELKLNLQRIRTDE
jgi:hypothetical protein